VSLHLPDVLLRLGPWALLVLCAAETAFVTGLVVPAGVATALAAFLASERVLPLAPVVLSAALGAALGDSIGFWLGGRFGLAALAGEGRIRRLARRNAPRIARLFGRHPLYAVSLARTVSFVRTLMPWAAGMSSIRYPRFLAYDLLGIAGWGALYVGVGYLAGESWRWMSGVLGTGWAVVFAGVGVVGWLLARRRSIHAGSTSGGEGRGNPDPKIPDPRGEEAGGSGGGAPA